ncbi:MFS transporter [Stappia sp.]|uniref:MFS transporter n=1 Tax=Stappia sp. TaxID=1870903 RepID=UPI0032D8ED08
MKRPVQDPAAASQGPWAVICLAASMLLASLGVSIANVALPALAGAFAAPMSDVQWVVIAYLLSVTVLTVIAGRLGDRLGRGRVMAGGLLVFAVATVLCALAPTLPALIAARAVQGLGAAVPMALAVALVRETVAEDRTGRAMGLLGTMSAVGTALGPALGGALIAAFDWRAVFLALAPVAGLAALLASRVLPVAAPTARKPTGAFDLPGIVLLCLALTAYALSMTLNGEALGALNAMLLAVAAGATVAFVVVERRVATPLVDLSALRDPVLSTGLIATALVSTVMMTTLVVGPFFLAFALGLSAWQVGLVMSFGPVLAALCGVPSGRLVDRCGADAVLRVGLAAMTLGALALAVLPAGVAGYLAGLVLLTPGYQLFQAATMTRVMLKVAPGERGVVSGMLSLSRNLGLITGAAAMGAVFAVSVGTSDMAAASASQVTEGLRTTFLLAAGALLGALALVILRGGGRTAQESRKSDKRGDRA